MSSLARRMNTECRDRIAILMGCAPRMMTDEGHRRGGGEEEGEQSDLALFVFFFVPVSPSHAQTPSVYYVLAHTHVHTP